MNDLERYKNAHDFAIRAVEIALYTMSLCHDRLPQGLLKDGIELVKEERAKAEFYVSTQSQYEPLEVS